MSLYPENPAGQVPLVSQDTYASANLPLSVIGSGGGGTVPANLVASTITLDTGGSISGVSTINGDSYPPAAGAIPSNLVASTLTISPNVDTGILTAPNIFVQNLLTLTTNGDSVEQSHRLAFNRSGFSNVSEGQLSLFNYNGTLRLANFSSIFSASSPFLCGTLILGGDDITAPDGYANIHYSSVTSTLSLAAQKVAISSIVNVSSINGINWDAISTLVG